MALSGFARACARRSGGIEKIGLLHSSDIVSVGYDAQADAFTALTLAPQAAVEVYEFDEDSAEYSEAHRRTNGSYSVEHRLTMALGRFDSRSREAVEEIALSSECGVVAVVRVTSGEEFLVGYSYEFGGERPLRLVAGEATTGAKPSDATRREITLGSVDTSSARLLAQSVL